MRRLLLCLLLLLPAAPRLAPAQTPAAPPAGMPAEAAAPAAPAAVQPPDLAAVRRGLGDVLSFATLGMLSALGPEAQVTPDGDGYRIRLPVQGLRGADAAPLTARARPAADGAWDIESLAFPAAATIDTAGPASGRMHYAIGGQRITAHIDPSLKRPSNYVAQFRDIRLTTRDGAHSAAQTIGRYDLRGSVAAAGDDRVTLSTWGEATDWSVVSTTGQAAPLSIVSQRADGHLLLRGLDRTKGQALRTHLQALLDHAATGQAADDGQMATHAALGALLTDATGLLDRVQAEETLEGVRLRDGTALDATAGSVVLTMEGGSDEQTLDGDVTLAVNELAVASAPDALAPYVPRHITLRNRLRDLPSAGVVALLRAALAADADPAALKVQAARLLASSGGTVSVDPFSFDSGPMRVTGTARLLPLRNGAFGGHVHLVASGVDALIAQIRTAPELAQVLPVLLIAKGLARPQGAAVAWDIDLDQAGLRINGIPFGHSPLTR